MRSFGVAASAATVAVYQVLHTVMLAPPKSGTHESFDGFLCGVIVMLGTTGERKNSKVQAEDDSLSMV